MSSWSVQTRFGLTAESTPGGGGNDVVGFRSKEERMQTFTIFLPNYRIQMTESLFSERKKGSGVFVHESLSSPHFPMKKTPYPFVRPCSLVISRLRFLSFSLKF
jgi:hypothetical protein